VKYRPSLLLPRPLSPSYGPAMLKTTHINRARMDRTPDDVNGQSNSRSIRLDPFIDSPISFC
jgi:hypothetical protein